MVLAIGSAILGAILGAYITNEAARRAEKRKAVADQITRVREACARLRGVAEQWYSAIADAIDPSQTPPIIIGRIEQLYREGRYEQEVNSQLSVIKTEPSCSEVVNAARIWSKHAYDHKDAVKVGQLYGALAWDSQLNRKYPGVQQSPEGREDYLRAVQSKLRRQYSDFDAALGAVIDQLARSESHPH